MIKTYIEYINELVLTSRKSKIHKEIDTILDEPYTSKSLSSGLLLKNKLREEESGDLKPWVARLFRNKQKKLSIVLNNLKFLKDELKKGELRCAYCDKGPLVIYDTFSKAGNDEEYLKFSSNSGNKANGATCDHKHPISKGGKTHDYENLCVCCRRCNSLKGSMDYDVWLQFMLTDEYKNPKPKQKLFRGRYGKSGQKIWMSNYEKILYRIKSNKIFKIISEVPEKSIEFEVVKGYDHLDIDKILPLIIKKRAELIKLEDKKYKVIFNERHVESFGNFMNEKTLLSLNPFIEDLMGIEKEEILDIILDINDIYDIHMDPCCFEYDDKLNKIGTTSRNQHISNMEVDICNYTEYPECEVINVGLGKTTLSSKEFDISVWGYLLQFWPKNSGTDASNRVCDYNSVLKIFNRINKTRFEKFDLEVEIVKKAGYSNNIGSALWAIAIYKA